jgi:exodeoxyribonuclease III
MGGGGGPRYAVLPARRLRSGAVRSPHERRYEAFTRPYTRHPLRIHPAWSADVLCLQETRIGDEVAGDFGSHFCCAGVKKGYAGVATFSKAAPLSVTRGIGGVAHDGEGRVLTLEFASCYVVNVYVPNSGMTLERLAYRTGEWDPAFRAFLTGLAAVKPVVVAGDLNVAYNDMDVHTPKTNRNKTPGFCDGERDGLAALLAAGFTDVFRARHPTQQQFTYWSARFNCRANNKGWRLDYALVSAALAGRVTDTWVRHSWPGSDHVPVGLDLKLSPGPGPAPAAPATPMTAGGLGSAAGSSAGRH